MPPRPIPSRSALSASQQDAVVLEASSLHISGRFGTGKTTALAHRAVEQSTRLHLSSTLEEATVRVVAASAERARVLAKMIERVAEQEEVTPNVEVVTVPQWAAEVVRERSARGSILRPDQSKSLMGEILSSLGYNDLSREPFEVWREVYERGMRGNITPGIDAESPSLAPSFPLDADGFRDVRTAYQHRLMRAEAYDIPRLLTSVLHSTSEVSVDALLVDDLYDLASLEQSFLSNITARWQTVASDIGSGELVAGELYGLGKADAFFPDEKPVQKITLEKSAVPATLARAAFWVAEEEAARSAASVVDETGTVQVASVPSGVQEAEQIAAHIRRNVENGTWKPDEITVCAGTAGIRETIGATLRAADLRVRVPGRPFYHQAGPSDLLAYLNVLANPHDDIHLAQIINRPSRGIGQKTQARIEAYAADYNMSVWDAIPHADENNALTSRARRVLRNVRELLRPLVETLHDPDTPPTNVRDIARDLIRDTEYLTNVTRGQTREQIEKEEQMERLLRELPGEEVTADNPGTSTARLALQHVLDRFALGLVDAADVDSRMDEAVTLSSIRDVRGLSSRVVIVAGLEEGVCPGGWAVRRERLLEEERQALARAMASASDTLLLTWAQSRGAGREEEPTTRSRFLDVLHADGEPVSWVESVSLRSGDAAAGYRASLRAEQSRSTAATPPTDAEIGQIAAGQRVRHPKLGDGTVESVTTDNGRRIAEVRFDERGTKTLQLKYTPLEVLG